MPNARLFSGKRPERPTVTRIFTDPSDPDFPIELSFRRVDALDGHRALDIKQEFVERYVTGNEIEDTLPADFPFVGDEPVKLSKALCGNVANLVAAQSPVKEDGSPNDHLWEFEDFVAMSARYETAWPAILAFAREIDQAGTPQKKIGSQDIGAKS